MIGGDRRRTAGGSQSWRVCIRSRDGKVAGGGVLVDRWHVLTCAHVVASATGAAGDAPAPAGELSVRFPFRRGSSDAAGWQVGASVPRYGWVPASRDGRGDLALLLLQHPAPADLAPARLDGVRDLAGRRVQVFGCPEDAEDAEDAESGSGGEAGVWLGVHLRGDARGAGESVPVDPVQLAGSGGLAGRSGLGDHSGLGGRRVERGFDGAGAFDPETGAVVGLFVAENPAAQPDRAARVIRMEAVVRYLPQLAPLLGGEVGPVMSRRPPVRTGPAPQRPLSDTELQTLFARFWAVPAMPSRSGRDYYVDALEKRLGGRVKVNRQLDDVMDAWAVLFTLLELPGTLRALAGLLRGMHVDHPAVLQFVELVELSFPDLLLEHAERVELEDRLMGVGWAWIGTAHRFATRRFGVLPTMAPTTAGDVIRDLEARGRSRGEIPALLVMVDELAHAVGGRLALDLHRWSDGVAERLGLSRVERRRLCDDADRRHSRPAPAYLVVVLTPDGLDLDRFLMSAMVLVADEPERLVFRDDVARTLAQIEAAFDDEVLPLVPEAAGGDVDGLVIEFVVPERLLDTPFERWLFDRHGFARPIGWRYPVVQRSRDRIEDPNVQGLWRAKTRHLQERGRQVSRDTVYHVARDARTEPASVDEASTVFARLVDVEEALVLAVPFPPDIRAGAPADVFVAGLRAGVPAIVWARVATDPAGFRQVVDGELLSEGPVDLPRQVWKYRLRHPGAIHPGHAGPRVDDDRPPLGLVFGEATRIPSQLRRTYRFRAPGSGHGPGGSRS